MVELGKLRPSFLCNLPAEAPSYRYSTLAAVDPRVYGSSLCKILVPSSHHHGRILRVAGCLTCQVNPAGLGGSGSGSSSSNKRYYTSLAEIANFAAST